MRRIHFVLIFCLETLAFTLARGAFERLSTGARLRAMCGASQVSSHDPFCFESNPASPTSSGFPSFSVSMTPGFFGMKELQCVELVGTTGLLRGTASLLGSSFGSAIYREFTGICGYAIDVDTQVSIGLSVSWYLLHIRGYGQAGALGLNIGTAVRLADQIRYGLSIRNMNQPMLGRSHVPISAEVLSSLEFMPVKSFLLAVGLTKDLDNPIGAALGLEWTLEDHVVLRVGSDEGLQEFGFGTGVIVGTIQVDYGASIHPELGISHHFSLTIHFP